MKVWNFTEREEEDDEVLAKYSVNPPNVYGFGHKAYYEHVVRCIDEQTDGEIQKSDVLQKKRYYPISIRRHSDVTTTSLRRQVLIEFIFAFDQMN